MNILSCFDGMSCGQIAAERAKLKVDKYYASEIDVPAMTVCLHNYPNTKQVGSITELSVDKLDWIDMIIGGSPCQDISNLNKFKEGLEGEKSSLFYHFYRIWQEIKRINPNVFFLLENVAGNKKAIMQITKLMGVRPLKLNANIVSAQNRNRLFWTNISVNSLPIKKNCLLSDILENNVDEKYFIKDGRLKWLLGESGQNSINKRFSGLDPIKAGCLTKRGEKSWNCNYVTDNGRIRTLTPIEYERLQCVPNNYTSIVPNSNRYEMLGNGWNVDIITHIFNHLPSKFKKQV